jgi:hypothetical protein
VGDLAERTKRIQAFYDWFEELEGFHIREERFWDDFEQGDKKEILEWLRAAFDVGFEAGQSYRD